MAKKIGRNAPCPCGSGQKVKRCCGPAETTAPRDPPIVEIVFDDEADDFLSDIDRLSNRVPDLLEEGRLDEALQVCHALRRRYPDDIDWLARSAEVYDARGEAERAADYYRRAASFARQAEDFDPEYIQWLWERAERLDPKPYVRQR